jgi:hypothetical protein
MDLHLRKLHHLVILQVVRLVLVVVLLPAVVVEVAEGQEVDLAEFEGIEI